MLFDTSLAWPGLAALVPVVGAMLVLGAQRQQPLDSQPHLPSAGSQFLLSSGTGLWWSCLPMPANSTIQLWIGAGLLLTLVLGETSLRWWKTQPRKGLAARTTRQQTKATIPEHGSLGALAVGLKVAVMTKQPWLENRIDNSIEMAANEAYNLNPRKGECFLESRNGFKSPECLFGEGKVEAVVWGDSHANATVSSVATAAPGAVVELSNNSAQLSLGTINKVSGNQCAEFNKHTLELVNTKFSQEKFSRETALICISWESLFISIRFQHSK